MQSTPEIWFQAMFSLWFLACWAFYMVIGGLIVEWRIKRQEKKDAQN